MFTYNFEKLEIWKLSIEVIKEVYEEGLCKVYLNCRWINARGYSFFESSSKP